MRVCLIHNLYPPFARGGAEKIVASLAQALEKRGDEVIVITTKPFAKKNPKINNYPVYYLPSFYFNLGSWPYWCRFFWHLADMFDLGGFWRIFWILRRFQPEVVITNNLAGLGLLTRFAIKKANAKHIHILHDIQLLHPSGLLLWGEEKKINTACAKIYQTVARWLFSSPDLVVSPSQWLADLHKEKGFFSASQIQVVPNPIIVNYQLKQKKIFGNKQQKKLWRWIYVGQIEAHKGVSVLVRAFSQLPTIVKEKSELIVVGSGSEFKKTQKLAKSYGKQGRHIYFLGQKDSEQVKQLMQASNYLIVPSLCYENSPTVIYEALSLGLPIVAFDLGGVGELLRKCVGCVLVSPASWQDLALAMERVFYQGQKRRPVVNCQELNLLPVNKYLQKIGL